MIAGVVNGHAKASATGREFISNASGVAADMIKDGGQGPIGWLAMLVFSVSFVRCIQLYRLLIYIGVVVLVDIIIAVRIDVRTRIRIINCGSVPAFFGDEQSSRRRYG